ncbi:MAG: alpha/beta hydrolase [Gemmatimonadaceae bacterium]|jgi:alpha-beta hydrolase superfamily lysophospholipase|nr:alpha/beta hydrolase [Gemmatimonadaceae bacterium]
MTAPATARRVADWKLALAAAVAVLAFAFIGARGVGYRLFERGGLVTPPNGPETPETFGAPYTRLSVQSGTRRLDATAVDAASPGAPVLVVAHGTNEALSYWADVQALWRSAGVASLVFDYSGFGASTGRATAEHCTEDVAAAWAAAHAYFGRGRRYVYVGYSLGTGPVLAAVPTLAPQPDGLALVAGYSSARAGAVAYLKVPAWTTWVMPDLWNNERAVRGAAAPVLVVHSAADSTFPIAMAERVAAAAGARARFVRLGGPAHADGHARPTLEYWGAVLDFARGASPRDATAQSSRPKATTARQTRGASGDASSARPAPT